MTLNQYIDSHSMTGADFAKRIGVSAASVTRIRQGRQNITLELAQRIVAATGGKVTLEALAAKSAA